VSVRLIALFVELPCFAARELRNHLTREMSILS
jgi:hypothetical protein